MKRSSITQALLITLFLAGIWTAPSYAAPGSKAPETRLLIAQNRISAKQAAKQAQRQTGGRVLSVVLKNADSNNAFYAVKVIKNGKVRIVKVPAN